MTRLARRALTPLFLAACLFGLSGCSALRLAYDNADIWLRWRADRYFDLSRPQEAQVKRQIEDFMAWHRTEALPKYARLIEQAARRLEGGLSREDLIWGYDSARAQLARDLQEVTERAASLLETVEPEQIAHLERRFAQDNHRYAEEFLSGDAEERRARRAARNVERLEEWFGSLSDAQAARVRRHSAEQPLIDELRDRERRRLQAALIAMLRSKQAREKLPGWGAQLLPGGGEVRYVAALNPYVESYMELLLEVDRLASPRQRQRAVSRLRAYASDLVHLSAGRTSAPAFAQ